MSACACAVFNERNSDVRSEMMGKMVVKKLERWRWAGRIGMDGHANAMYSTSDFNESKSDKTRSLVGDTADTYV